MSSELLSPVATQTANILSVSSPRKGKLKFKIKELQKETLALKDEIEVLLKKQNNPSQEDFLSLCYNFVQKLQKLLRRKYNFLKEVNMAEDTVMSLRGIAFTVCPITSALYRKFKIWSWL